MKEREVHVVTGAFGFSGKYIAERLLDAGHEVRTLTNSPTRSNTFDSRVRAYPYDYDKPEKLVEHLAGASVLYNNYWVRFNHANFTYSQAVSNSRVLFEAAKMARVKRVVHVSITNPAENSPFEYFRGKALLEKSLIASGLSYAILRPAVLFGREDILINNIAWFLRKFPVFGVFGKGDYRLQPIHVGDFAELAVSQGQRRENIIIDAVGPETYTYRGLIDEMKRALNLKRPVVNISPSLGCLIGSMTGRLLRDVTITCDEIAGLMADLLNTGSPPAGKTKLSEWLRANAADLGRHYSNELNRRTNRTASYEALRD